jgi:VanZ family protein
VQGWGVRPASIPQPVRTGLFAALAATIVWLSMLPSDELPDVGVSDKLEHALAYFALTLSGLWALPRWRWVVFAGVVAFGVGVEFLQAGFSFDRQGDWRDALANATGALVALLLARLGNGAAFGAKRRLD